MNPSVCLLTAHDAQFAEVAALTLPHMADLARRHGYEFRATRRDECSRAGGWLKIEPIRDALSSGFDMVLWLDVDCLVVRKDVDIRDALRPGADLHMAWHEPDPDRFPDPPHYNSGVMLIRSTDWARGFFERVWDVGQLQHHWHDQATILHVLGYDDVLKLGPRRDGGSDAERIARLDTAWNSIFGLEVADDPIIHHYAGVEHQTRVKWLAADERTVRHRERAAVEVRRVYSSLLNEGLTIDRDAIRREHERLNVARAEDRALLQKQSQELEQHKAEAARLRAENDVLRTEVEAAGQRAAAQAAEAARLYGEATRLQREAARLQGELDAIHVQAREINAVRLQAEAEAADLRAQVEAQPLRRLRRAVSRRLPEPVRRRLRAILSGS